MQVSHKIKESQQNNVHYFCFALLKRPGLDNNNRTALFLEGTGIILPKPKLLWFL